MIIHDAHACEQGSVEWLKVRMGKVTASEVGNLVTKFGIRDRHAKQRRTYIYGKIAEAYRGTALPGFSSFVTDQGIELEMEARATASDLISAEIHHVGFIERDDMPLGCSPDGVIYEANTAAAGLVAGIEIKSPQPTNAARWAIEGVCPAEHVLQVQASMLVTGLPFWLFFSYSRGIPNLLLKVKRDEEICATIEKAAALFKEDFEAGMAKLKSRE